MTTALRRTAGVAAMTLSALLLLAPAASAVADRGPGAGAESLGTAKTLLYFVGGPLAIILLLALLVMAPTAFRGARYRPGKAWNYAPVWFGGPAEHEDKLPVAAGTSGKGGASGSW